MKRLGKFTGKIYSAEANLSEIKECCVGIDDDISDKELSRLKLKNRADCCFCRACPIAKSGER